MKPLGWRPMLTAFVIRFAVGAVSIASVAVVFSAWPSFFYLP